MSIRNWVVLGRFLFSNIPIIFNKANVLKDSIFYALKMLIVV